MTDPEIAKTLLLYIRIYCLREEFFLLSGLDLFVSFYPVL